MTVTVELIPLAEGNRITVNENDKVIIGRGSSLGVSVLFSLVCVHVYACLCWRSFSHPGIQNESLSFHSRSVTKRKFHVIMLNWYWKVIINFGLNQHTPIQSFIVHQMEKLPNWSKILNENWKMEIKLVYFQQHFSFVLVFQKILITIMNQIRIQTRLLRYPIDLHLWFLDQLAMLMIQFLILMKTQLQHSRKKHQINEFHYQEKTRNKNHYHQFHRLRHRSIAFRSHVQQLQSQPLKSKFVFHSISARYSFVV